MKITIIGGKSFLGNSLLNKIISTQKKVKKILIFSSSDFKNIDEHKYKEITTFIKYSYPKFKLNLNLLIDSDVIFFCSALGLEKSSEITDDLIFGLNTFEPIQLSIFLERNNYSGKLVTFGSYFEIGINNDKNYFSEIDIVSSQSLLLNSYSLSKKLLTTYYSSKSHNILWYHFILPHFYGKNEKSVRFIPYLIDSIKNNKKLVLSEGNQLRQFLHINDITDLMIILINSNNKSSMYNLAPNDYCSINEIKNLVFKLMKFDGRDVETIKKFDEDMKYLIMSNKKVKKEFNWNPKIKIDYGISNYFNL